ncbi:probable carboxylesterase 2 [Neltuma alba]|uniref:probable carboxylesterase 2 n=1 Tax=Neltuma alba TaxID=207710 RepID=UPI0010A316CF|nr:probable carboxylesterase 2 [Prosopis alba]
MDSSSSASPHPDVVSQFTGSLLVERFRGTDFVPPSSNTVVSSKDVTLLPQSNISARLFLPQHTPRNRKLPLLLYFHGGGFLVSSPFNSLHHNYVSTLVANANIVAVSIDYSLAPEHPIPAAYEDSWAALHWVASHRKSPGPEPWLNEHADFRRVFLAGDSVGANIVHNLAMAAGNPDNELDLEILGAALVHPFFWGSHPTGSEAMDPERKASVDRLWPYVCPSTPDQDDPRLNPVAEESPSLAWLGCGRVLVRVAEKDILKERGWLYYNALSQSGWLGVVEIHETQEEDHCFHLEDLGSNKAQDLIQGLADFFNRDMPPLL